MTKKVVSETFAASDQSPAGAQGSIVPDPVDTGDVHANRPQDQGGTDAPVADVRGQDIPRSAMLAALIQQLMGMDNTDLAGIIADIGDFKSDDATQPGAAAAPLGNDQAVNLQSVTTKEDVAELFAGEQLSEAFMEKTSVLFEAAVLARTAALRVELEEKTEAELTEAVETLTEEMATQIDKYLSYVAEQFVAEQAEQLALVTRSVVAEQFMARIVETVSQFNLESDTDVSSKVGELEAQVAELNTKINEGVDSVVQATAKIKELEAAAVLAEVSATMSPMQRDRFSKLAEGIEFEGAESYKNRLTVISESVIKSTTPKADTKVLTEDTQDGVAPVNEDNQASLTPQSPVVRDVMAMLRRGI